MTSADSGLPTGQLNCTPQMCRTTLPRHGNARTAGAAAKRPGGCRRDTGRIHCEPGRQSIIAVAGFPAHHGCAGTCAIRPPARRRDVEASAGLQVAPRGEDMHVSGAVALAVHHGRPEVLRELKKIKLAWPDLNYSTAPGGLILHLSTPAITPLNQGQLES